MNISLEHIDKSWTLFLDRDGVINLERKNDYVKSWSEFEFSKYALDALSTFNQVFGKILVVTNQRGVGKGIMSIETLNQIHENMTKTITLNNGRIDKIYFSTAISNDDDNRKPNIGMASRAKSDFSDIQFSRSIMIGNRSSDMQFGRNAGMYTVFVTNEKSDYVIDENLYDIKVSSMFEFSKMLS